MRVASGDAVDVLRRTPAILQAMFTDLPDSWAQRNEGPDTWSPHETLAHIVAVEPTWIARVEFIATHGPDEAFPVVDRTGHLAAPAPVVRLVEEFTELRTAGLERFETLDIDPDRPGLHPELGPVRLGNIVAAWPVHDLNHIGQIVKTMAKQYRDAIGPWRSFLAIVDA